MIESHMLKPTREVGLKSLPQVASDSKQPQFNQEFIMWYAVKSSPEIEIDIFSLTF